MDTKPKIPKELLVAAIGDENESYGKRYIVLTNHQYAKIILGLPGVEKLCKELFEQEGSFPVIFYDDFALKSFFAESQVDAVWAQIVNVLTLPTSSKSRSKKLPFPFGFHFGLKSPVSRTNIQKAIAKLPKGILKHKFAAEQDKLAGYPGPLAMIINTSPKSTDVEFIKKHFFPLKSKSVLFHNGESPVAYVEEDCGVGCELKTAVKLLNRFTAELDKGGRSGGLFNVGIG